MKKLLKLYQVLKKSSKVDETSSSGKSKLNIPPFTMIAILVVGFLFYFCMERADMLTAVGGAPVILEILGLIAEIGVFFYGMIRLINEMYMSSDIEILITLPLSSLEIVFLRILSFLEIAVIGSVGGILAGVLGYAFGAGVLPDLFVIILSSLLLPIFTVAVAGTLIILVMSVLRALRNREVLKYIGMGLLFVALCAYLFLVSGDKTSLQSMIMSVFGAAGTIKYTVPVIGFAIDFMTTGNFLYLGLSVLITVAAVGLFALVAKALYLRGALNMQDAGKGRLLSDKDLAKYCQKRKPSVALLIKEFLLCRRSPAYALYDFIIGALWPVLVLIIFKQLLPIIQEMVSEGVFQGLFSTFNLEAFVIFSFILSVAALAAVSVPIAMQTLAYSSISREGKSLFIMKQIPVSYADQLEAKRSMARNVAQVCITGYTVLIMIAVSILLKISFLYCIVPIIFVMIYAEFRVDLDMYLGIKNAIVSWDDEKAATKKTQTVSFIDTGFMLIFFLLGGRAVFKMMDGDMDLTLYVIILCVIMAAFLVAALLLRKKIAVDGEEKIQSL